MSTHVDDDRQRETPVPGLEQLPMARLPERDLWPGIESRLKPRRGARPWWGLAAAASLVAALGGGLALQLHTRAPTDAPVARPVPARDVAARVPDARQHYVASAQPESRVLIRANLAIVDDAQHQLRRAMASDPQAVYLQRLMSRTEARQQELRSMLDERQ